MTLSRNKYY